MRNIFCIAILVLGIGSQAIAKDDSFSLKTDSTGVTVNAKNLKKYPLKHSVDGYEVNCNKTRLVVWGKPKKLNVNNPQDSYLSLVDLAHQRIIKTVGYSKGIFGVRYLRDGSRAMIDSDLSYSINLKNGKSSSVDPNASLTDEMLEACSSFPNKSFAKYKD